MSESKKFMNELKKLPERYQKVILEAVETVSSQDLFNALVILDKKINGILLVLDEMNKREEQKMNIGKSF